MCSLSYVHVYRIEYVSYRQGPYRIRIVSAADRIVPALDSLVGIGVMPDHPCLNIHNPITFKGHYLNGLFDISQTGPKFHYATMVFFSILLMNMSFVLSLKQHSTCISKTPVTEHQCANNDTKHAHNGDPSFKVTRP